MPKATADNYPAGHPLAGLPRVTEEHITAVLAVTETKRTKRTDLTNGEG